MRLPPPTAELGCIDMQDEQGPQTSYLTAATVFFSAQQVITLGLEYS